MTATILLGTLKKNELSHTDLLCKFLVERMQQYGIAGSIVKLLEYHIVPATSHQVDDEHDQWPQILHQLENSDMIIFATPIWWGNHSSMIQRVIERLDAIHDEILAGSQSRLYGKVGGIVISGDSDGAQHIIGNISNFFSAIGISIPPFASLSVLWEGLAKGSQKSPEELMQKFSADYRKTADTMIEELQHLRIKLRSN